MYAAKNKTNKQKKILADSWPILQFSVAFTSRISKMVSAVQNMFFRKSSSSMMGYG